MITKRIILSMVEAERIPAQESGVMSAPDGKSKIWRNDKGQIHRLDGPAVERADGTKEWWVDGKRHRLDGPAVEYANAYKEWWVDDKLHRLDGPAVEWADGYKAWYVDGEYVPVHDQEEFVNWLLGIKI